VPDEAPQEVPGPGTEAAEPAQVDQPQPPDEVPEPVGPEVPQQAGQEVPANNTAPQPEASQTTMSADPWWDRTIRPDFNDHAAKKPEGRGDTETERITNPNHVPRPD
jgi:hypothetical protein